MGFDKNLCRDNHVSLNKVLQAIGAIDQQTEEFFYKLHLRWEKKKCADTGVMLALIDPSNYPTSSKPLRKMSKQAAVNRRKWYTSFVNEVTKQATYTQVAADSSEGSGDLDW
eukprot:854765-Amphidinium_carterae.1